MTEAEDSQAAIDLRKWAVTLAMSKAPTADKAVKAAKDIEQYVKTGVVERVKRHPAADT